jgi:arylsulfatase A-like enzyme
VVLILCDDLGYGDIGPYGGRHPTPHLDRLARDGARFTSFYVSQPVCSASRASLMTGCYPSRVGIAGALGPGSNRGLSPSEFTLPRLFKQRGYATAIFGKWHLGDSPRHLPTRAGFDEWFGIPYSSDMWPGHPADTNYPPLPLFENERIINTNVTAEIQRTFTAELTRRAVDFIRRHRASPFFVYLPYNQPHVPLFTAQSQDEAHRPGLYGEVIREIDSGVGAVLATLEELRLDRRTLVLFLSDNGPWLLYGDHAGSALPLREGKATTWEGGVRVPFLARWPGRIPAGLVTDELATTLDLLPTLAGLIGGTIPAGRPCDGVDAWTLFSQPGAKSPRESFYYYWLGELHAVRAGPWKLHLPHTYPSPSPPGSGGRPGAYRALATPLALYDLASDAGETRDCSAQHPEIVRRLQDLAARARADLGDTLVPSPGTTPAVSKPAS